MNYEVIWAFIVASSVLAISPGPDNIFVLTQGMAHGKKYGIATTAGLVCGCLVHISLLAFGVSAIIAKNESLYWYIKLFGAAYLFYLAYKVFSKPAVIDLNDEASRLGMWALFKQGFIMNVLNPKVAIFFLAFFPGFLFSTTMQPAAQFFILGGLFMSVTFLFFGLIAVLSGAIASSLKKYNGLSLGLKWLQITVFIGIAIYLLISDN